MFEFLIFNCEHIKVNVAGTDLNRALSKHFYNSLFLSNGILFWIFLNLSFIVLWFFSQIKADVISVLPLPMLSFHVSLHWGLFIRLPNFFSSHRTVPFWGEWISWNILPRKKKVQFHFFNYLIITKLLSKESNIFEIKYIFIK